MSFFFSKLEHPVEIYLGAVGDLKGEVSPTPLWKAGTEAEPIGN